VKSSILFALAACALLSVFPNGAALAAYPERLVKIVVPFAPGGGTDVVARTLAQEMSKDLGVSVIIENKPGAGTIIGTQSVATSAPDGYTLLMGTFANAVNPSLQAKLPYDAHGDFVAVALVARSFNLVVVNPASPIKSIADLVAAAKAEPDKLSYGTYGTGTSAHLAGELFKHMAKVNLTTVPYKGRCARHHRSARRTNPGDVHDGGECGFTGRVRAIARDRRDLGGTLAGISAIADGVGSRRPRLCRRGLVRRLRTGEDAARDHRPPEQIGRESRASRCLQKTRRQRRPWDGGRAARSARPIFSPRGSALAPGHQGCRHQAGVGE
jgi:hypothetical protein